jgi:hypothetical protein
MPRMANFEAARRAWDNVHSSAWRKAPFATAMHKDSGDWPNESVYVV